MTEKIIKENEFRLGIQKGIDDLADVVKDTLGPMGRTVIIKNAFGELIITKGLIVIGSTPDLRD